VKRKICILRKHNPPTYSFYQIFNFLPIISTSEKKQAHLLHVFEKTRASFGIPLQEKQKYQVTNVVVKSEIIMFATSMYKST